ncbi:MAG: hypothetical protein BWY02_02599 [bacterium ADurb.Bin157]|nr:MAG: hypothetical protein BWY02_02599 [bacterium ADurb.Bin157]
MKLLTEELKKQLPALYSQENEKDPIVYAKFFTCWSSWCWYAYEFDGEDLFFGKVFSHMCPQGELGYFSLSELEAIQGPIGLRVERDIHFKPTKLSECK